MADRTTIEWSDATWNPIAGCTRESMACQHCYAERLAARNLPGFEGLATFVTRPDGTREARWTGKINVREHLMDLPLRWKKPRRIFVNSMSDLFHPSVPDEVIDRIFAVMALCPQHTFQILTKRQERMRDYLSTRAGDWMLKWPEAIPVAKWYISKAEGMSRLGAYGSVAAELYDAKPITYPLPNVWIGISAEDQGTLDDRAFHLEQTPAAVRFLSFEPALGFADLAKYLHFFNQVICGGETGPKARPMHPDIPRKFRDQCAAAGVPFFFKKWGEWAPQLGAINLDDDPEQSRYRWAEWTDWGNPGHPTWDYTDHPQWCDEMDPEHSMIRVGKRLAGRLLDGVEHNGMPATS